MYEITKTLKKFGWTFAEIMVAGSIMYVTDRPEYLMLVPLFEAIRNYIKHR